MVIRVMTTSDYEDVYKLWSKTSEMGMRNLDDSKNGIEKFLKITPIILLHLMSIKL